MRLQSQEYLEALAWTQNRIRAASGLPAASADDLRRAAGVRDALASCGWNPAPDPLADTSFSCPGCRFRFAGRTAWPATCQYCGHRFPALPSVTYVSAEDNSTVTGGGGGGGSEAVTVRVITPLEAIMEALCEPLGLGEEQLDRLAPYGKPAPGRCRSCLRGPLYGATGLCIYCRTLERLNAETSARVLREAYDQDGSDLARWPRVRPVVILWLAIVLMWTGLGFWLAVHP